MFFIFSILIYMTTINKSTFDTVDHMNSKLDEITEQPHQTQSNQRPKTIHEVRTENRPAVSSALSRLGRPPIGVQLASRRLVSATPEEQQQMVNRGGRERGRGPFIEQPSTSGIAYAGELSQDFIDVLRLLNNRDSPDRRLSQIRLLSLVYSKVNREAPITSGITTSIAELFTKYQEVVASVDRAIQQLGLNYFINWQQGSGGRNVKLPLLTSQPDDDYINYFNVQNVSSVPLVSTYRIDNSERMLNQYIPSVVYRQSTQQQFSGDAGDILPEEERQRQERQAEEAARGRIVAPGEQPDRPGIIPPVQPVQPVPGASPQSGSEGAGQPVPGVSPQPGSQEGYTLFRSFLNDIEVSNEELTAYIEKGRIEFTQKLENGIFTGIAISKPYRYQPGSSRLPDAIFSELMASINTLVSQAGITGLPTFVWLGPQSLNNGFATGIADLVSFYHDVMYQLTGASGASQNIPSDILSIKYAKLFQYAIHCRINNITPLFNISTNVNGVDFITSFEELRLRHESNVLGLFITTFRLTDRFNPAATSTLQPIEDPAKIVRDFLDNEFLVRHMKIHILLIWAFMINEETDLSNMITDFTEYGIIHNAKTLSPFMDIVRKKVSWENLNSEFDKAIQKLQTFITNEPQNEQLIRDSDIREEEKVARINQLESVTRFYTALNTLFEFARMYVDGVYIKKDKLPVTLFSISRLKPSPNQIDKNTEDEIKAESTLAIDESVSDVLKFEYDKGILYNLDTELSTKLLIILRHLVIEGAVAY